jgi:hypothetical protein
VTAVTTTRCPVCREVRITFEHAGKVKIRQHTTNRTDAYKPDPDAEDCAGSWQPIGVEEGGASVSAQRRRSGTEQRQRQVLLGVRVTAEERRLIRDAAEARGVTVATFMREAALRAVAR